jgi:hypothetical protein
MSHDPELPRQLTPQEVDEVLAREGGWCHLLELARMGRIDAEAAVTAIEAARPEPLLRRLAFALADTISGRSDVYDL